MPFTPEHFLAVFEAYNRALWPLAALLWLLAVASAVALARRRDRARRFICAQLVVQWVWPAVAYHAVFFTRINPAAWIFSGLFLLEGGLLLWHGAIRDRLRFSATTPLRHVVAWTLIVYGLAYPAIARLAGLEFPRLPTFGVPCPATVMTIGFLIAADPPIPLAIALVPLIWTVIGGSASFLMGVEADLMLPAAGLALTASMLAARRSHGAAGLAGHVLARSRSRSRPAIVNARAPSATNTKTRGIVSSTGASLACVHHVAVAENKSVSRPLSPWLRRPSSAGFSLSIRARRVRSSRSTGPAAVAAATEPATGPLSSGLPAQPLRHS